MTCQTLFGWPRGRRARLRGIPRARPEPGAVAALVMHAPRMHTCPCRPAAAAVQGCGREHRILPPCITHPGAQPQIKIYQEISNEQSPHVHTNCKIPTCSIPTNIHTTQFPPHSHPSRHLLCGQDSVLTCFASDGSFLTLCPCCCTSDARRVSWKWCGVLRSWVLGCLTHHTSEGFDEGMWCLATITVS